MRRGACLLAALLTSAAARAPEDPPAQGPYPITLKEAGRGTVRLAEVSQSTLSSTKIVDAATGRPLQEKAARSAQESAYRETVLDTAPGQRRPLRLRREYQKAIAWTDGRPEVLPYQGKAVVIEKEGALYQFLLEGVAELTGPAARVLEAEFNKEDNSDLQRLLLPARAVRPGESWRVDMGPVAGAWQRRTGMRVDAARSSGAGRLDRVYRKDGRLFGVMAFRLEMPIAALAAGGGPARADAGSRVRMDVALDCCIDGGSSGTLRADFWADGTAVVAAGGGGRHA